MTVRTDTLTTLIGGPCHGEGLPVMLALHKPQAFELMTNEGYGRGLWYVRRLWLVKPAIYAGDKQVIEGYGLWYYGFNQMGSEETCEKVTEELAKLGKWPSSIGKR